MKTLLSFYGSLAEISLEIEQANVSRDDVRPPPSSKMQFINQISAANATLLPPQMTVGAEQQYCSTFLIITFSPHRKIQCHCCFFPWPHSTHHAA